MGYFLRIASLAIVSFMLILVLSVGGSQVVLGSDGTSIQVSKHEQITSSNTSKSNVDTSYMTTQFPLHDTAFADEPYTQTFSGNTLGVVLERSPENTEKRKLVVLQAWGHKGPEEGSPSVGDYLKQQLGKYKLTVDEFSQKILDITHQDIDPSLINRWKRNDDIPNRTNTQLLAQAFDQLEMTRLLKNTALH